MRRDVPYCSQFASSELVGEIVAGRMRIDDDPRWRESGAASAGEYARWAGAGCGMACLQMLLGALGRPAPGLVELGRGCERYGGYRAREDGGLDGLFYAGFVAFAAAEFGLDARVAAPLGVADLLHAAAGDEVVMASVNKAIRTAAEPAPARGGHLVLVIDADPVRRRLCFHNPSGHEPATQQSVWLDAEHFEPFYASRGIAVRLPRQPARELIPTAA
jgi:hypothetical protein